MLKFLTEGIRGIFSSWTALQLAMEGQWGGTETDTKYVWFVQTISDYLIKEGDKIDPIDIEEILEQIISDEFLVQLEDNSALQLRQGNLSILESVRNASKKAACTKECPPQGLSSSDCDEDNQAELHEYKPTDFSPQNNDMDLDNHHQDLDSEDDGWIKY
ncbi:hypothetical protein DI09_111p10 [Mitosporidium daphniae]|uniref:Pre-rRNA-processing protein TSR2 n=1 Tax=Mitosporidium daphniae TaxID=1485682 RepID=A0A098VZ99_9MICR|nr:uncharacterized protein DI09_111p10 [Mitosporidium daphniae]KGG53076.1 hypothetical protein DI09_111p10 [Mitosporidium daphniae]|eukprot:XP_013239518.1 uncharacterized protein DI09_111p10 [Mitosporidium daphniae]